MSSTVEVILLGQAPSATSDPGEAFSGKSGARLAELCGLTHADFLKAFTRRNVADAYAGKQARGNGDRVFNRALPDDFPAPGAGKLFIAVGAVAAQALGVKEAARHFQFYFINERIIVTVPHPSGVNRWWNEPTNVVKARKFWRWLAQVAGAGAQQLP